MASDSEDHSLTILGSDDSDIKMESPSLSPKLRPELAATTSVDEPLQNRDGIYWDKNYDVPKPGKYQLFREQISLPPSAT
jgi:hypothetical protein